MPPKKNKLEDGSESDWSYHPSGDEGTSASDNNNEHNKYNLRDPSRIKPPDRYREDEVFRLSTRPSRSHHRPIVKTEPASHVQWDSIPHHIEEPYPSEMADKRPQTEREGKANGPKAVNFRPFPHILAGDTSSGPCVAHLSRKSPPKDPMAYVYERDESIFDKTKFHPPSDKWDYQKEYDAMFSLEGPDEDTEKDQREQERRMALYVVSFPPPPCVFSTALSFSRFQPIPSLHAASGRVKSRQVTNSLCFNLQDWTTLSDGIKWAIVYDMKQDHGFTNTTRMLSLSTNDIINFRMLYRRERAKWEEFKAKIGDDVHCSLNSTLNQAARPFQRLGNDAPSSPALHLVTDSLGKEEIEEGRRFLKFMGLDKYAAALNKWFGSGGDFHEMPEVENLNLDFLEESHYRGFQDFLGPSALDLQAGALPVPELQRPEEARNMMDTQSSRMAFLATTPPMPDPAGNFIWPPLIDKNYNPDGMALARSAFAVRPPSPDIAIANPGALGPPINYFEEPADTEYPVPRESTVEDMQLPIFDPIARIRAEADEDFRRKMNPDRVIINGNAKEQFGSGLEDAGYRYATEDDLVPGAEEGGGFQFPHDDNDFVPYVEDDAVLYNADSFPQDLFEEVIEEDFLHDFAFDPPPRRNAEPAADNAAPSSSTSVSASADKEKEGEE